MAAKKTTTRSRKPTPKKSESVASAQGRARRKDLVKDNAEAEKQQTGPLQPPESSKPEGKPKVDLVHALSTLRDGVHPGTPYGYVHKGVTQRDRLGVPYINDAEAKGLEKKGLVTIEDSKIRPAA